MKIKVTIITLLLSTSSFAFDYTNLLKSLIEKTAYSGDSYGLTVKKLKSELEKDICFKEILFENLDSIACSFSNNLYQYDFQINYRISNDSLIAIPSLISCKYDSTNFLSSSIKRDFIERNEWMLDRLMYYQAIWQKEKLENIKYQNELLIKDAKSIELRLVNDSTNVTKLKKQKIEEFRTSFMTEIAENQMLWCDFTPFVVVTISNKTQSCELQICFDCEQIEATCSNGKQYSYSFYETKKLIGYFNTLYPTLDLKEDYNPELDILRLRKEIEYIKHLNRTD